MSDEWRVASGPVVGQGLDAPRVETARRGEKPHPLLGELHVRVEAGSMAGRRQVVGLGFVAGRAEVEVGGIRRVRVQGRVGSGIRNYD